MCSTHVHLFTSYKKEKLTFVSRPIIYSNSTFLKYSTSVDSERESGVFIPGPKTKKFKCLSDNNGEKIDISWLA